MPSCPAGTAGDNHLVPISTSLSVIHSTISTQLSVHRNTPSHSLLLHRSPAPHPHLPVHADPALATVGFFTKLGLGQRDSSDPSRSASPKTKAPSSGTHKRTSSTPKTPSSREGRRTGSGSTPRTQTPQPRSDFAASAFAAASAGMQYERQIDENTDMSTLTDQEIMRLMEGMDGDVMNKPLITGPVHLLAIKGEYLSGSSEVLRKLEWLQENGWDQVWRARGDGDCFYRSFTLAYLLRILYAPSASTDAAKALSAVHDTMPMMASVGFQQDLVDEFIEPLVSVISAFVDPSAGQEPTEFNLLEVLQNAEKSNSIVVALRLITGAYIRTHPDDFAPFLFSPSTLEPVTPDQFCREEVEPCGKEADHAQIMALAAALGVPVRVAYLDRSEVNSDDVINWVEFGQAAGTDERRPLTLLYRPGHFDVVTKDQMGAALARDSANAAGPSGSVPPEAGSQTGHSSSTTSAAAPSVPAASSEPQADAKASDVAPDPSGKSAPESDTASPPVPPPPAALSQNAAPP